MGPAGLRSKGQAAYVFHRLPHLTSQCLLHVLAHPRTLNPTWAGAVSAMLATVCPESTTVPGTYWTPRAYSVNDK